VELLESQRAQTRALEKQTGRIIPHVFHRHGEPIRDMRGAWDAACERANVPGVWIHDLRRTAMRNLERAGVSRSVAMKLTGHKTEAVYRRYAIADSVAWRKACRSWRRSTAPRPRPGR
jgi:integrase